MGRKRTTGDGPKEPILKLEEKPTSQVEWILFECPKGYQRRMESEVNPVCPGPCCNYRRKMKPRQTCSKCNGTGQKFPGARRPCTECWGKGNVAPSFTPEESE